MFATANYQKSEQKMHEDKYFGHSFYSMDLPAEANDLLGANPISFGMTNDLGLTLRQTGFLDDELMLERVMGRADWIIQLPQIFYSLLD